MHCCLVWSHGQTDKHTDRRTNFLLQIFIPRGPKSREKKFQLDKKKKVDIDPITIYVRRRSLSEHITTYAAGKLQATPSSYNSFNTLTVKIFQIPIQKTWATRGGEANFNKLCSARCVKMSRRIRIIYSIFHKETEPVRMLN